MIKKLLLYVFMVCFSLFSINAVSASEDFYTAAEKNMIESTKKLIASQNDVSSLEKTYKILYSQYLRSKSTKRSIIYSDLLFQIKQKLDQSLFINTGDYTFYRINNYNLFVDIATYSNGDYVDDLFESLVYMPTNKLYMIVYSNQGKNSGEMTIQYQGKTYKQITSISRFLKDNYSTTGKIYAVFDVPMNVVKGGNIYVGDKSMLQASKLIIRNDIVGLPAYVFEGISKRQICMNIKGIPMSIEDCIHLSNGKVYEGMDHLLVLYASLRNTIDPYQGYKKKIDNSTLGSYYCKDRDSGQSCFWVTNGKINNITEYSW